MEVKAKELDCILPGKSMFEILSRLPVKSLMKFTCVKKSWYNLVKDPRFIQLHSDNSSKAKNNTFITVTWNKSFWHKESKFSVICPGSSLDENIGLAESGKVAIVGSANGLVCLTYLDHRFGIKFKVVNPALRQQQDVCKLAAHSCSIMTVGFGFNKKNGDYKILRIGRVCDYNHRPGVYTSDIKLYSLRSHSWKTIKNPTTFSMIKLNQRCMVTIGSGLHFMAFDSKQGKIIVSFDLSTEKFVYYAAPGCYEQILPWENKSLAVIVPDPINIFRGCYKVLVLNNCTWQVGMKLSLDGLPDKLFETSTRNHNEFPFFCEHDKSNYLLYLVKKTKKKNVNVSPFVQYIMSTHIYPYRESLVPLVMPPSLRVFKTKASKNLKEAGKAYEEVHYVMSVP